MRLDFTVPEFLRVIWSSNEARAVWEPRIQRISNAWPEIERLAVHARIKPAALQVCSPEQLVNLTKWATSHDLVCIPLGQQGVSDGYANGARAYEPGRAWGYRILITNLDFASIFMTLWAEQDHEGIGAALGFPQCCREFFLRNWVKEGWRDLTYPMVGAHGAKHAVSGPLECNILLRWLGVRLVSHLPCSFNCDATQAIGARLGLFGIHSGYVSEMDWLTQMLNWPVRWSSLHGVGIVTTPVCRLVFDSTSLKSEVVIDRDGPEYPKEAARGTVFPFRDQHQMLFLKDEYTDNGFKSKATMDKAHDVIVEAFRSALSEITSGIPKVTDLGCGNGVLLERLLNVAPHIQVCGVESDREKHQRAARRLLAENPDIRHGDIFDDGVWDTTFDVAIVSRNRFREVGTEKAAGLFEQLRTRCDYIIFYSYEHTEWPGLGRSDGLELLSHHHGENACAMLTRTKR
jgi:hypothetical protein